MLQITTLQGYNSNKKTLSLAYVIRKDLFLSKSASREEICEVRFLNFILFYLYVCFLGRCAKIVFECSTNTLQRLFNVMLKNN